jgi:hypothetical protein
MDLIILNDGIYSLYPVTKQMLENLKLVGSIDCFDLCEILRLKLTTYANEPFKEHIMNNNIGIFYGCICK